MGAFGYKTKTSPSVSTSVWVEAQAGCRNRSGLSAGCGTIDEAAGKHAIGRGCTSFLFSSRQQAKYRAHRKASEPCTRLPRQFRRFRPGRWSSRARTPHLLRAAVRSAPCWRRRATLRAGQLRTQTTHEDRNYLATPQHRLLAADRAGAGRRRLGALGRRRRLGQDPPGRPVVRTQEQHQVRCRPY